MTVGTTFLVMKKPKSIPSVHFYNVLASLHEALPAHRSVMHSFWTSWTMNIQDDRERLGTEWKLTLGDLMILISKIICPISDKNPMDASLFRPELVFFSFPTYLVLNWNHSVVHSGPHHGEFGRPLIFAGIVAHELVGNVTRQGSATGWKSCKWCLISNFI